MLFIQGQEKMIETFFFVKKFVARYKLFHGDPCPNKTRAGHLFIKTNGKSIT
jgi:hypothetical protein